jgi:hypothetical protein
MPILQLRLGKIHENYLVYEHVVHKMWITFGLSSARMCVIHKFL